MEETILTSEQKQFLEDCVKEFNNRYTEHDDSFMKIKLKDYKNPPIVDPWYSKPYRQTSERARFSQNSGRRNHYWDSRNKERNERVERHSGKHYMYHRQKMY